MPTSLLAKRTESLFDQLGALQNQIMRRAYEIFDSNGHALGQDLDHWLQAEREFVWKPAMELEEKDNEIRLQIAAPGIDPKDIHVEATGDSILIKGESRHEHKEDKGKVHVCEFTSGNLFRSVHLPKKIDPDKVKAEFKNGMLTLTAEIAKDAQTRRVSVAT